MFNFYGGPSIDTSYQVSVHLAKGFQRRLKCEKLMDDGRQTTNAKWRQKLTLPLAVECEIQNKVKVWWHKQGFVICFKINLPTG